LKPSAPFLALDYNALYHAMKDAPSQVPSEIAGFLAAVILGIATVILRKWQVHCNIRKLQTGWRMQHVYLFYRNNLKT
jgi:hypothetical protein